MIIKVLISLDTNQIVRVMQVKLIFKIVLHHLEMILHLGAMVRNMNLGKTYVLLFNSPYPQIFLFFQTFVVNWNHDFVVNMHCL